MDNSFESVWFPKWLVLLGPGSCYPSGTAHFPHLRPKLPLESIDFSSLWWRKPWDYTSNIDITVKCQLCCGIPLKPVVSHLWEMDLRSVMLSSRASSSHPCFSMWWEHPCFLNKIVSNCLFKSVLAKPGLLRHSSRWTFNVMSQSWGHWKIKASFLVAHICLHHGASMTAPSWGQPFGGEA